MDSLLMSMLVPPVSGSEIGQRADVLTYFCA